MVKETHDILRRASVQIYLDTEYPKLEQPTYHLQILQAVMARDTDKAIELLEKDIGTLKSFLQEG
jgi:DNA-binding GntR family transcriptional regulator